eukprot:jgi/Bigna1/89694/estExt_fgenesh1_pg.C_540003
MPAAKPLEGSFTQNLPIFLRKLRWRYRTILSEFFGTFLLMALGLGVCAQVTLFGAGGGAAINVHFGKAFIGLFNKTDRFRIVYVALPLLSPLPSALNKSGWGLAVALAVYTTGGVSAHLNPAVTLTFALFRGFPWDQVIPFWIAQISGAFIAAGAVYLDFKERLELFEARSGQESREIGATHSPTAAMFATFPGEGISLQAAFFDEFFTTALLLAFIFALDDQRNVAPKANMGPFLVGMVVFALCMSFSSVSGLAMNPARDLGPRIFISLVVWDRSRPLAVGAYGWGSGAFYADDNYWWVPVIAPFLGGPVGALMYELFVCVDVEEEIETQLAHHAQANMSTGALLHGTKQDGSEPVQDEESLGSWHPIGTAPTTAAAAAAAAALVKEIPEVMGISRRQSKAHALAFGKKMTPVRSRSTIFTIDKPALNSLLRRRASERKLAGSTASLLRQASEQEVVEQTGESSHQGGTARSQGTPPVLGRRYGSVSSLVRNKDAP